MYGLVALQATRKPVRGNSDREPEERPEREIGGRRPGEAYYREGNEGSEDGRQAQPQLDIADLPQAPSRESDHGQRQDDPKQQTKNPEFEVDVVVLRLSAEGVAVYRRRAGATKGRPGPGGRESGAERILGDDIGDLGERSFPVSDGGRCGLVGSDAGVTGEESFASIGGEDRGESESDHPDHQNRGQHPGRASSSAGRECGEGYNRDHGAQDRGSL